MIISVTRLIAAGFVCICFMMSINLNIASTITTKTSCARGETICPAPLLPLDAEAPRAAEPTAPDRNVAVGSHGEYVSTVTAAAA